MRRERVLLVCLVVALLWALPVGTIQPTGAARISERVEMIPTYAFSEPNPIPILARDTRLYPYHSFEGYTHERAPRPWRVVTLENDFIEVFVLPEIGGKVWGARVKATGHEFIYRNEVMKFRNIALRGPWTSGGIEFNFGVVGHAPSTATPVDYALRQNADGSVSCIVGTMDLPSRTEWRVEIRLPAGSAAFETNVLWHNPTPLEQPYYNWMTAAAAASDDLEMSIPGNAYLTHPGAREDWPRDDEGRFLPAYRNNAFGPNKSYHVVGELQEHFGGYYRDAGRGFGHWARHEDLPGQKLWLWALSRAGGIWEDLLTDTDGQYVEYQAGRLLVQYTPDGRATPITQAGFDPFATDRWTETWFPIEGIGGLTTASRQAAVFASSDSGRLTIGVNAFTRATDTLRVWSEGRIVLEQPVSLVPLVPSITHVPHEASDTFRIELRALGIDYASDPAARTLSRPFETDRDAASAIPAVDRLVFEAKELMQARRHEQARPILDAALAQSPWHRGALLAMADLEYRRARYAEGLTHVNRALSLDAYDAHANFIAGNLHRALGHHADARDAFGWAARSLLHRSAAYVQLAELALQREQIAEAERYARLALDFNRANISAWEIVAIAGRTAGRTDLGREADAAIESLDPLNHFRRAERYLARPTPEAFADFMGGIRNEFPDQTVIELAMAYVRRGRKDDAVTLLTTASSKLQNPLIRAWRAWLEDDASILGRGASVSFVFPYRLETLPVLTSAAERSGHWSWTYLRALLLWSFDRPTEALALMEGLGEVPDIAAVYVARAHLTERAGGDPEGDLRRAEALAGADRVVRLPLIQFYQRAGRWQDALSASSRARGLFAQDFNLALLHVRNLIHLGRGDEALAILKDTRVLPSEHARDSHRMYVQAQILAALAAFESVRWTDADAHLTAALDWPEHLGQGKPYNPDERLIHFLRGRVADRAGRPADARRAFEAVVAATTTDVGDRVGLLAAAARLWLDGSTATLPIPAELRQSGDLDDILLVRALSVRAR